MEPFAMLAGSRTLEKKLCGSFAIVYVPNGQEATC